MEFYDYLILGIFILPQLAVTFCSCWYLSKKKNLVGLILAVGSILTFGVGIANIILVNPNVYQADFEVRVRTIEMNSVLSALGSLIFAVGFCMLIYKHLFKEIPWTTNVDT